MVPWFSAMSPVCQWISAIRFVPSGIRSAAGLSCTMVGSVEGYAAPDFSMEALRGLSKVLKKEKISSPWSPCEKYAKAQVGNSMPHKASTKTFLLDIMR